MRRGRVRFFFLGSIVPRFRVCLRLVPVTGIALLLTSCAPHMYDQASLRPFKQQMPPMPRGTTPVHGRASTFVAQQAKVARNPLPATRDAINNGRIYYGYYCQMCHGRKGDGDGPVGQSYVPKPTDLSSALLTKLTDGELYAKMLTGKGHDPVMIQTVQPDHRWPLVAYIRTFGKKTP